LRAAPGHVVAPDGVVVGDGAAGGDQGIGGVLPTISRVPATGLYARPRTWRPFSCRDRREADLQGLPANPEAQHLHA
jgi:hypothetical protein